MTRLLVLLALLLAPLAGPAIAQEGMIRTDHVSAQFVVRNALTAPGEATDIAIAHTLAPGWHTYWLNPGDSGDPPIVDFDVADRSSVGEMRFPAPSRLPYPPLMNFGFTDEFTLLTSITVPADWPAGEPFRVPVRVDWLVCEKICIPEGGTTEVTIPTGAANQPDSGVAFTFVQAEWSLPKESDAPATYSREADSLYLTVPFGNAEGAVFFPRERGVIDNAAEQVSVAAAEGEGMTLTLVAGNTQLDGTLPGVLKTSDGAWWITATGDPDDEPLLAALPPTGAAPAPGPTAGAPILPGASFLPASVEAIGPVKALLFAFLGGLILNLMPCVFPVLALKALGLVRHADAPFSRRATIGAAYASGILTSFAILAGVLLALKGTGVAVGWGFQLQSPVFVAVMTAVIVAVGLNLSGVFEIGAGLTRLGARTDSSEGVGGAFATGCLATIVATPCSAPFMAVAIGTALAASELLALGIFAAMGLGLAAPFVALTLMPGLTRVLPKPGVWMVRLKQALAFLLYATAAWLVWVLAQLVAVEAMLGALIALVLIALAAWLFGLSQRGRATSHRVAVVLAILCLPAAVLAAWPTVTGSSDPRPVALAGPQEGVAFSPDRLAALRAEGEPVFLNVTAAWCISCKVNERVVFESSRFADLLATQNVTFMTADWTRRDPDVSALLEGFGRAGVPLYAFYPANGEPQVLPQILTIAMLEDTFATN